MPLGFICMALRLSDTVSASRTRAIRKEPNDAKHKSSVSATVIRLGILSPRKAQTFYSPKSIAMRHNLLIWCRPGILKRILHGIRSNSLLHEILFSSDCPVCPLRLDTADSRRLGPERVADHQESPLAPGNRRDVIIPVRRRRAGFVLLQHQR